MKRIAACLVSTLLSACNLGGGSNSLFSSSSSSSGGSSSGGNAGPEGIWTGVDSVSNQPMVGIVEASGVFDFIRNDGVQFVGQAVVSGTSITANDEGFAQIGGATFANNATYGTGSFSGTVATDTSITVSTTFTPLGGTMTTGTWSLTFDTLYDSGSSFAMIGGTYKNASSGPNANASVTVSSSGVLYGQGATSGCVLNGQVSPVNPTYDAYSVTYTYANCGTGAYLNLNGVSLAGLGVFNSANSQLIIGVTGSANGITYGDVLQLTLQ